jgi:phospholipid transport system substrate-binding protein
MQISNLNRRQILSVMAGAGCVALAPMTSLAMSQGEARTLIDRVMADVQSIVNSGASESRMYARFEQLFDDYADVPVIARSALGPPARSASASQMSAYTQAFRSYMARTVQSFWEVDTTMTMRGQPPFEVRWHVSDRGGSNRFFNIIIEGVNVLAAERQEIGSMLERRGGNLDRMIRDLQSAG